MKITYKEFSYHHFIIFLCMRGIHSYCSETFTLMMFQILGYGEHMRKNDMDLRENNQWC